MTASSNPIVFFGTEAFSLVTLRALVDAGFAVAAVVTKPDSKKGRGQRLTPPEVKIYAEQHNIPVWQPTKLAAISEQIQALEMPVGVLVSYGKLIPQSIIDLFSPGIINLHPSLLPRYRGPSPIESAILHGDHQTGISLMQLSAAMDAGPVYDQQTIALSGSETAPELYEIIGRLGSQRLVTLLPAILDGSLQPVSQDDGTATYCKLLTKADGHLTPTTMTAREAERRIRAFLLFPKSRLAFHDQSLIITKAHVSGKPAVMLDQKFQDDLYLCVDELVASSGKTMSATAFLHGQKE